MKLDIGPVVDLLHAASVATLATLAGPSSPLPGHPYATAIPNVPDAQHRPLLLISALAEHTRNLLADPRASLSVLDPDSVDAHTASRLTLLGTAEPCPADTALVARYLRYQPQAAPYLELDFMFFRVAPQRLRPIAGLGRMGWIAEDAWAALPALAPEEEEALLAELAPRAPAGVRLLGVDPLGLDCETDGRRRRLGFGEQAADLAAAAAGLLLRL